MTVLTDNGDAIAAMSPAQRHEHVRRLAERMDELEPRQRDLVLSMIERLEAANAAEDAVFGLLTSSILLARTRER